MESESEKTVLLVEDQAIIAMAEAKTLKKHGFKVLLAKNGKDAIKIASENSEVNLILMDIDLGKGMDGTEAAQIILQVRELPIVFLSNHTEKEIVDKTEKITSYGYVVKNSGETVLIASIKMAFRLFEAHSQLKCHEKKLRENEQRFRYALEGSSDGIWDWNVKTNQVYFSPRYYTMLGFEPDEFSATFEKWVELLHPDDAEKTVKIQKEAIEKLNPFEVEFRLRKKDGTYCWILSRGTVTEKDKNGKAVHVAGSHSDIDKRKIAEQALISTQQMLRSVLNNIPVRVFWKDLNSNYLGCNLPFALDAGLESTQEIIGKDDFSMGWKDQAQLYRQDDHQVMASGIPKYNYEEPQTRKDGKINLLKTNKIPLKDLEGNIIGVLGTYEDITEKKLFEEKLKQSEENYRRFFEEDLSGVFLSTPEGKIKECNQAYVRMMEYDSIEELLKSNPVSHYPESQQRIDFLNLLRRERKLTNYEGELVTKKGKRIQTLENINGVFDDKGTLVEFWGYVNDITEIKNAEQTLKNAALEKEALHRELLHRVKNSFNHIISLLYFEREKVSDPKANKVLENLERRIGTLSQMYTLLNESGVSEQIDLGEYLNQVIISLTESYIENKEQIKIISSFNKIYISPKTASSVGLIVNEILTNSFKYAFPEKQTGIISVSLKAIDGNAEIEITDNGIGLSDNFNFEESPGMGLQLVNMLIQQINGDLKIESRQGTSYNFVFPID